jgi:hypothetical protein
LGFLRSRKTASRGAQTPEPPSPASRSRRTGPEPGTEHVVFPDRAAIPVRLRNHLQHTDPARDTSQIADQVVARLHLLHGLPSALPEARHLTAGGQALPASFGLTVGTAGDPTLNGPDFRSVVLSAVSLPTDGPLGIEVVLGPTVRLEQSDLARLAATFTPTTSQLGGSGFQADLSVQTVDATLSDAGIMARASGQVVLKTLGIPEIGVFSASATLRVVPTTVPGVTDPVDLVTVSDLQVQLPGLASGMADAAVALIRGHLTDLLTDQLRAVLRVELPAAISRMFVLAALPPDVVVSVRNLSIDGAALQFQPALGALGTTLSTYTPPAIPPAVM